jgi:CRISPR-associated endonuclease Cas1
MEAPQTVPQVVRDHNIHTEVLSPRRGVVTLFGYGSSIRVERGHLIVEDGIGNARRRARFSRMGHGLKRLVSVGSDGTVSLAALRWLADQDASFVMLNRNGSVLATTGPVRPSDARLRRAQALTNESGIALHIARELIDRKLVAQEQLVTTKLNDSVAAEKIEQARDEISHAQTLERIRYLESKAGLAYWSAWRNITITFPTKDIKRVPEHWLTFGTRASLLTHSPRLAINPVNAMLNYLYAVLESETRLAVSAQGLDPGFGVLHFDRPNRDSLACDIMEPTRPQVDAYVLDWILRQPLRKEWFFEQRDGSCRLMGQFANRLSETAPSWGQAVAPMTEWVSRKFWSTIPKREKDFSLATRLTQSHRRQAKGGLSFPPVKFESNKRTNCAGCGKEISSLNKNCESCAKENASIALTEVAKLGRIATHSPQAEARRAETMRRQMAGRKSWNPSDLPDWLTEQIYRERIQPRLREVTIRTISTVLQISEPYAASVREGRRIPHARHWKALARIADVSLEEYAALPHKE